MLPICVYSISSTLNTGKIVAHATNQYALRYQHIKVFLHGVAGVAAGRPGLDAPTSKIQKCFVDSSSPRVSAFSRRSALDGRHRSPSPHHRSVLENPSAVVCARIFWRHQWRYKHGRWLRWRISTPSQKLSEQIFNFRLCASWASPPWSSWGGLLRNKVRAAHGLRARRSRGVRSQRLCDGAPCS